MEKRLLSARDEGIALTGKAFAQFQTTPNQWKILILTAVFAFGITLSGLAQDVRVVLKNWETKTENLPRPQSRSYSLKWVNWNRFCANSLFCLRMLLTKTASISYTKPGTNSFFQWSDQAFIVIEKKWLSTRGWSNHHFSCQDSTPAFQRISQHLVLKKVTRSIIPVMNFASSKPVYAPLPGSVTIITSTLLWYPIRSLFAVESHAGQFCFKRRSGVLIGASVIEKGISKHRVGQGLHADVMKNLEDFERLRIDYTIILHLFYWR